MLREVLGVAFTQIPFGWIGPAFCLEMCDGNPIYQSFPLIPATPSMSATHMTEQQAQDWSAAIL
jgi:hypothetical protein